MEQKTYDVVVIGGGAAGLSGALALARVRRSVLVIDSGTARNAPAAHMHNYLGREGTPPGELLATTTGYQTRMFAASGQRLGIELARPFARRVEEQGELVEFRLRDRLIIVRRLRHPLCQSRRLEGLARPGVAQHQPQQ